MEKVIVYLEEYISRKKKVAQFLTNEIQKLHSMKREKVAEIDEKREYGAQLRCALEITEFTGDAMHSHLFDELERTHRLEKRLEDTDLRTIENDIKNISADLEKDNIDIKNAQETIFKLKGATPDPTADVPNNTFVGFVMGGLVREANRELPEMYVKGGRADEDWRLTLESSIHLNNAINESVVEGLKNIEKALLSGQTIV